MKKQIYALLLLLMVCLSASAQTQFWYRGVHYEVSEYQNAIVIAANNGAYSGKITIPETVYAQVYASSGGGYYETPFKVVGIGE